MVTSMFDMHSRRPAWLAKPAIALLLVALSLAALAGCGGDEDDGGPGGGAGGGGELLQYVPADAVAIAIARPKQLLSKKEVESFPIEVASAAGVEYLGIDPLHVDTVLFVMGDFTSGIMADGPPAIALIIHADEPIEVETVFKKLQLEVEPSKAERGEFYASQSAWKPSAFAPDEHTLAIGSEPMLRKIEASQGGSPLAERLMGMGAAADIAGVVDVAAARKQVPMNELRRELPEPMQGMVDAFEKTSVCGLSLTFGQSLHVETVIHADDAAGAEFIADQIKQGLEMARGASKLLLASGAAAGDEYEAAFAQYLDRVTSVVVGALAPKQEGAKVTVAFDAPFDFALLGAATMTWTMRASEEMHSREVLQLQMEKTQSELDSFNVPPSEAFPKEPSLTPPAESPAPANAPPSAPREPCP